MSDTVKLIIEIPKEAYNVLLTEQVLPPHIDVEWLLIHGIPLDSNSERAEAQAYFDKMNNGEVMISLYPNLKYTIQNGRVITTIGVASSFDLEWWNAPYQKGGE